MGKAGRIILVTVIIVTMIGAAAAQPGYQWWFQRQEAAWRQKCVAAMKAKQWPELDAAATGWLKLNKNAGDAWLYLGEASQRQGDFERTALCLGSLEDDDPKCVAALLELVELQLAKINQPLAAVETCERILRIDPNQCTAHQRIVFFYAMTLQRREMIRRIRRSMEFGCASREMYVYLVAASSLAFTNGYQVNSRWMEAHADYEPVVVARAVFLGQTKSDDKVQELATDQFLPGDQRPINECLERFPNNIEVLAFFVEKSMESGDIDRVAELLARAPDAAETDSRFWRFKGWYLMGQGEFDEAEAAYREALRWDPYDWRSRHELTTALRRLNKMDEVAEATELAFEGKTLERELLKLASAVRLPPELEQRIGRYALRCGDVQVARQFEVVEQ